MATKTYTFTGTLKYAYRLFEPDIRYKTDSRGGTYSVVMNLSPDSLKLYNALGLKAKPISEQDVAIFKIKKPNAKTLPVVNDIAFRRNERHPKLGELGAPEVVGVPEGKFIGDGTTGEATVEVYSYTFEGENGFAARLVGVEIIDFVEYVKPVETNEPPVF